MKILNIETPGLFITIPGTPSFRTPGKIDISKVDINVVFRWLKMNGIHKFKIESEEPKVKKVEPKVNDKKHPEFNSELVNKLLDELKKTNQKIDNLENIVKSQPKETVKEVIVTQPKETKVFKREEPKTEEFIPKVDISGMSIKGNVGTSIEESKDDILKNADSLKTGISKYKK